MPAKNSGLVRENAIRPLCDGARTSKEIAAILGESPKYVQRIMKKYDLPRLPQAPRPGAHNPSFVSGRRIDRDGYVLVSAPLAHPYARMRDGRSYGVMYEHRLVMEERIGRALLPSEVVDHIDGLRLHNAPANLRLFDKNASHLQATISGCVPKWSAAGAHKLRSRGRPDSTLPIVDTYDRMKKSGDARLRQILLAALQFGLDSPYLLGTHHHLAKAGIDAFDRSSLEHALGALCHKYA